MKKIKAYIVFEDGSGHMAEYTLEGGLSFRKSEMEQWIKEQSKKPVKSIFFMSNQPLDPTQKAERVSLALYCLR